MGDKGVCRTAPATPGLLNRRGSPIDCRPSTAEAPPIGNIHPCSKIAVTLECDLNLLKNCNIVYFMTESTIFNHKGVAAP